MGIEKRVRNTGLKRWRDFHVHRHDLSVRRHIEQFLPIAAPAQLSASARGDLEFACSRGERLKENLAASFRFLGGIGHPAWIPGGPWGKLALRNGILFVENRRRFAFR